MTNDPNLNKLLLARIKRYLPADDLYNSGLETFFLGGNFLNLDTEPNDIDIFPCPEDEQFTRTINNTRLLSQTSNARTLKSTNSKLTLQLCNFHFNCLEDLVDSFDFSHVQIGARISLYKNIDEIAVLKESQITKAILLEEESAKISLDQLYYSKDWASSKLTGEINYTGSNYPLSSLIRLPKYLIKKKSPPSQTLPRADYIRLLIPILNDLIQRGFKSKEDFKDQLDAVDISLAEDASPENWATLFNLLIKAGNIKA